MSIGLARVTISAPQRRIDVALPEHVPLVELLPEVLRHAGEGLADDGERHGGWLLRRTDGGVLAADQALYPQGVRDGEILHLVPARERWPELEYDDVVEAIAEGARRRGAVWTARSTRTATLLSALVLLAVGLLALLITGPRWSVAAWAGLGVGVLLTVCGVMASRAYGDVRAGSTLAAAAMPYAFVGGALLVSTGPGDRVGALAPLPWLGGPELLAGAAFFFVAALLGAVALGGPGARSGLRIFSAGMTIGLLGVVAALVGLVTTAAGAAAVLISLLVCGIGLVPLLAVRFGRIPTPPVTLPTGSEAAEGFTAARGSTGPGYASARADVARGPAGPGYPPARGDVAAVDPARERPDRATVYAAVGRAEEVLAGMLIGHAVLAAAAFLVLSMSGSLSARILMSVSAVALLLRARLFVTVRQRAPLVCAGLAGVVAFGFDLLGGAGVPMTLGVIAAGVALALATVAAGATYSQRPPSPYLGRAIDLLDVLVVVSVIPVACAVVGLYGAVNSIRF